MRQVFTSARLETVEGVAALLNEHGIQTRITQGRSYKGNRRGGFSYINKNRSSTPDPAVWVVLPDDQAKARSLLREAGLMGSTREGYSELGAAPVQAEPTPRSLAARMRMWLLIAVVILGAMTVVRACNQKAPVSPAPIAPPPVPSVEPTTKPKHDPDSHIVPVDTSLIQSRPAEH